MNEKIKKIAVLGDGAWGCTLAILLSDNKFNVHLWGAFPDYIDTMKKKRENVKFLPGIIIPSTIVLSSSLEEVLFDSDIIILSTPSQFLREILVKAKPLIAPKAILLNTSKGLEIGSFKRMSEIIQEVTGSAYKIATLSGPTIASEVANKEPGSAVVASRDIESAVILQNALSSSTFRVYTSTDIIGVELGGSLKNIVAIAAGISDGLGFGTNAKSALMTRGIVEIMRLGVALGAQKDTFNGLSGIGDMITTCVNQNSRNRWFGEQIGKGKTPSELLKETEKVVEGMPTTKATYELAKKLNIDVPITNEMYEVLYKNKSPKIAVRDLMTRSPKHEN